MRWRRCAPTARRGATAKGCPTFAPAMWWSCAACRRSAAPPGWRRWWTPWCRWSGAAGRSRPMLRRPLSSSWSCGWRPARRRRSDAEASGRTRQSGRPHRLRPRPPPSPRWRPALWPCQAEGAPRGTRSASRRRRGDLPSPRRRPCSAGLLSLPWALSPSPASPGSPASTGPECALPRLLPWPASAEPPSRARSVTNCPSARSRSASGKL
mmetsp:Transcript_682/g.2723  ORF Transcript_682/g.2723 Transcript_682/m.2723 type:complete len:210 (-) Transcript_682:383-1012(-)